MRSGSILIAHPNGLQQEVPFSEGSLRIGSAPDNDLIITGPEIAPYHATIICDERGHLVVEIGAQNIAGQGGMRLTFNLPQVSKKRALAWIGDYVVSYQPAPWDCRTQRLRPADLPPAMNRMAEAMHATHRSADETDLLHTLLNQSFARPAEAPSASEAHEAVTIGMPALLFSTGDE